MKYFDKDIRLVSVYFLFMQDELSTAPAKFITYFERLLPTLRSNVAAGLSQWTNNNCEAMNHVIKQFTQWRPQQLPELLDKLKLLSIAQHVEADRALIGRGDLQLLPAYAQHRTTLSQWSSLSAEQQQKLSNRCFKQAIGTSVASSDSSLTVPSTPGGGKKPQQTKRKRSCKTVTIQSRKRVRFSDDDDD